MILHPSDSAEASRDRPDVDRLLAGYRAARAQETLFDLRPVALQGPVIGYDEFLDEIGNVRPAWADLADAVGDRGRAGMSRLSAAVRRLVDNDDITYTGVDPAKPPVAGGHDESSPWRLDPLPLVVSAPEWEVLEAGLVQRSRVLNAVLADVYGNRRSLTEGVLPPERLRSGRQRNRSPGTPPALHACLRCQPAVRRQLSGERRLDPSSVRRRLCAR
jgi:uncharacterized circularly permuted ATP-grasp superfamily protein